MAGLDLRVLVWFLMALRWWGMGSSTLLGPEGSAVCWLVVLVLPLLEVSCWGLRVLVGLLFEICIVVDGVGAIVRCAVLFAVGRVLF